MNNEEAYEFLRLVVGEVCPCGHEKDDHGPPEDDLPGDFVSVMGECAKCECKGLME